LIRELIKPALFSLSAWSKLLGQKIIFISSVDSKKRAHFGHTFQNNDLIKGEIIGFDGSDARGLFSSFDQKFCFQMFV